MPDLQQPYLDILAGNKNHNPKLLIHQITLLAAHLYREITASDCEAWQSLSKHSSTPEQTPHINAAIRHHDETHRWALRTITTPTDQETQVQVTHHLIAIAAACRALNNFATLASIVTAVTADDPQAERARQSLDVSARTTLTQLQSLVGNAKGYLEYRRAVRLAARPCVPWLAFTLTDLRFIEEVTPSLKKDGSRNELKDVKTRQVVAEMQRYQSKRYDMGLRVDVQGLICDCLGD